MDFFYSIVTFFGTGGIFMLPILLATGSLYFAGAIRSRLVAASTAV